MRAMKSLAVLATLVLLARFSPVLPAAPSGGDDPVARVVQYYAHLNDRDYRAAWDLKSPASRQGTTFEAFRRGWEPCESVGFYGGPDVASNDGRTAVVTYRLGSVDRLGADRLRYGHYQVRTTLVRESGRWWIARIDVGEGRIEDNPRFEVDRPDLPVPALPRDVPVPPGFQMGRPVAVKVQEAGDLYYAVRARRRVRGASPTSLLEFYQREMPARGWREESGPAGGGSALAVGFRKGAWRVSVDITSTTWGGTDAPADPRGTTLEFRFRPAK